MGDADRHAPAVARYIGIDYSGARTPAAGLKGLRIDLAECDAPPVEVPLSPSPCKELRLVRQRLGGRVLLWRFDG